MDRWTSKILTNIKDNGVLYLKILFQTNRTKNKEMKAKNQNPYHFYNNPFNTTSHFFSCYPFIVT
jgi:hypothetical protein